MNKTNEYAQDYAHYQSDRSWLRRFIRKAYLRNVRRHVIGRAIDFGCGVGELLSMLPNGSSGLEINPYAVDICRQSRLDVRLVAADQELYELSSFEVCRYQTLVISHVLEHLEDPDRALINLMKACDRIAVKRIVVVVPGSVGYASDPTHRQFIDLEFLRSIEFASSLYSLTHHEYFPINFRIGGDVFAHNELIVTYDHRA